MSQQSPSISAGLRPVIVIALAVLLGAVGGVQVRAQHGAMPDSLRALLPDSLRADTAAVDALPVRRADDGVDTLVKYSADEIDFDVIRRVTVLLGGAVITYKDMRLEAGRIEVDWDRQLLTASAVADTSFADSARTEIDTVIMLGRPHFVQGADDFYGDEIAYNMKSRIGRVKGGTTTYEDGYYYGEQFKRIADDVISVRGGNFTTCDADSPHYHFEARTLKVIVGKRVVARPVVICFDDVPVLAAPYGIFPQQRGRTSGIIVPTFGESASQGRFLRDIGYYLAISDYMDASGSFDYFEKFGILGRGTYRYNKRYVLSGETKFDFNTQRQGGTRRRDYAVTSAHSHTINRNTRLTASGRYVSNKAYVESVGTTTDRLTQTLQSNATLAKSWDNSPWSLSANTGYTQDLNTDKWTAVLPAISLTHKQGLLFPPPKPPRNVRGATVPREINPPWYRAFSWTYSVVYRNELSLPHVFREEGRRLGPLDLRGRPQTESTPILGDDSTSIFQKAGFIHTGGVSANARILKYINLNPRISARSLVTRRAVNYRVAEKILDREDDSGLFQRTTFDLGTSATTKLYGMARRPFGIAASFRHVMTPSVGFTYRPDFADEKWGYFKTVALPDGRSYTFDRFAVSETISGDGGTPRGLSERFNFSLDHLFQLKTREPLQGEEDRSKKFDLLSWTMGTGVDIKRDSLRWDNLAMSWRTSIPGTLLGPIQGLAFDLSTAHSFYDQVDGQRVRRFYWERDGGEWYAPLDLLNAAGNMSFSIRANTLGELVGIGIKRERAAGDTASFRSDTLGLPPDLTQGLDRTRGRTAPQTGEPSQLHQMPLTIGVNLRQSRDYTSGTTTSALGTRTTFSLTPRWEMSFDYTFDLDRKVVRNAGVFVSRDLHCWEATFQWSPLGYSPGYFLRIGLKSPQLRDVKVERHRGTGYGGYF